MDQEAANLEKTFTLEAGLNFDPPFNSRKPVMYRINGGCWECVSHMPDKDGYRRIQVMGERIRLNRFVYLRFKGPLQPNQLVRHSCDNPSCINPDHLLPGTDADNMKDRGERNRTASCERNGRSKLTILQAVEIVLSPLNSGELARIYNVNHKTIWDIKKGNQWKILDFLRPAQAEAKGIENEKTSPAPDCIPTAKNAKNY